MKRNKIRLPINRDTLRVLTAHEQRAASGGLLPTSHVTCDTITCIENCDPMQTGSP